MSGQHVGSISDAINNEAEADARRSSRDAMKRLMKPTNRAGGPKYDIGDGEPCPEGHGRMYLMEGGTKQHCSHADHNGRPRTSPFGELEPSRKVWSFPMKTREN